MKSVFPFLFIYFLSNGILFAQSDAVFSGCGTDWLMNSNSELLNSQSILDRDIYQYLTRRTTYKSLTNQTYTIPVVVHIVHNGGPEDISDAQVQNAIADINAKYARSNADQIQFCLAQRDPNGNATTGITRDISPLTSDTMEVNDVALKNINRWDPTCYLNIWVIKQIVSLSAGNGVIGYAYFPSSYGTNIDGVVIRAGYFGSSVANDAVGTHEIGHYFGLYHTFQNGCGNDDCLLDGDHVCDTPPDQTTFASCNPPSNSCSTDADDKSANNPFTTDVDDDSDDYMDYSDVSCYNNFTPGQYTRMLYFFTTVRYGMLACKSCETPCLTPLTATITSPSFSLTITTGSSVSFAGTAVNSTSYQWYVTPGNIVSTTLSASYTFTTMGDYWMKFRAISSNSSLCNDAFDSLLIEVIQPVVASCSGSLVFDTANASLHFPLTNQSYSSNGFTWECWFKLNAPFDTLSSNISRPFINNIDNTQCEDMLLGFGWQIPSLNNNLVFRVDGPGGCAGRNPVMNTYKPPGGFQQGVWYHAAGVMDYANHISKIFVNGQLVSSLTNNAVPITRVAVTEIGFDAINVNPGYSLPALGANVDEIRVWTKARADSDILNNYNKCLVGNEPNLLYYYRCNQSAGSVAVDASINHTNATLYNGAAWSTQQPAAYIGAACFSSCIEICGNGIDDDGNGLTDEGCSCPSFTTGVSRDTSFCQGDSVMLTATGDAHSLFSWKPAAGLNDSTGPSVIATPTITTTYTVTESYDLTTSGVSNYSELIYNSDFSLGNTGFANDYILYTGFRQPGYYDVAPGFFSNTLDPLVPDHSPTSDNMFMSIDGKETVSRLWEQTIYTIGKNQDYKFSFWATRGEAVVPHFEVHFIGDVTGDSIVKDEFGKTYTDSFPQWDEYSSIIWNSGNNNNVTIRIIDLETNGFGNDFAMDDISLRLVPPVCTNSKTVTVTVNNAAPKAPNLGNDISLCTSGTHTFNAGGGFEKYRWQDGTTDSTFTAYLPGKYWVTVKNFCSLVYLSDTVSIIATPAPTLDLGSDINICRGADTTLSYTSNGTFTHFQWTPDTAISCTNCPSPVVHPAATAKYYLSATTTDGCTNSDSVLINVGLPCISPQSNFSVADSELCANDCITFTNNSINATSYSWAFPGGQPLQSTDENPRVCYSSAGTFSVTLIAYNLGASDSLTLNHLIKVKPAPPAPAVTHHHDTLSCHFDPAYTSYQWYSGNEMINGATDTFIVITQGGDYYVKVRDENGCSIQSGIDVVGINEYSKDNYLASLVFNPATKELYITGRWKSGNGMVFIYDVLGKKVIQQPLKPEDLNIVSATGLAAGIYFVRVTANEGQYVQKIVVQ